MPHTTHSLNTKFVVQCRSILNLKKKSFLVFKKCDFHIGDLSVICLLYFCYMCISMVYFYFGSHQTYPCALAVPTRKLAIANRTCVSGKKKLE